MNEEKWLTVLEKLHLCYAEDTQMLLEVMKRILSSEGTLQPTMSVSSPSGEATVRIPLRILLRLNTILTSTWAGMLGQEPAEQDKEHVADVLRSALILSFVPVASKEALPFMEALFHPDVVKSIKANMKNDEMTTSDLLGAISRAKEELNNE